MYALSGMILSFIPPFAKDDLTTPEDNSSATSLVSIYLLLVVPARSFYF